MPPSKVTLPNVWRGDVCELAIALLGAGPVVNGPVVGGKPTRVQSSVPLPAADLALMQSTYTLIECQFKFAAIDEDPVIDLSSVRGDLRFEVAARLPDGTTGPAIVIRLQQQHTRTPRADLVWDMQFSGAGVGPYTLFYGDEWKILQDRTRTARDPVTP